MTPVFPILLLATALFLVSCGLDQPAGREENYVTVRLDDSLSRYDSVRILILADGDTDAVIGKAWDGRLASPQEIPPYRLDDAESRPVSVRVLGYDQFGRLILDMRIVRRNGELVVSNVALPKPSPDLSALEVGPGALSPAFDPAVKEYAMALAYNQTWLQVTMTPVYPQAIMSAGLARAYSGQAVDPIDMRVGSNRIVLNVTAADTSAQYVLIATRAQAPTDTVRIPPDTVKVPPDTIKVPPDTLPQGSPFAAWKHMALISPDFTQVGMENQTVVSDFPVLLRLTPTNFNLAEAGENGKDIRFTNLDHRVLPHEIVAWDAPNGSARIWIKTDTLRGNGSVGSILMYWGNPSAASASDPAKVFTAEAGWSGVWHLEEEGKGAAGEFKDATGRFHGTASGKVPSSRFVGAITYAQDFKAANDQSSISIPSAFDPGPDVWTMILWVKQESQGSGVIFSKGDGTAPNKERFQLLTQPDGRLGLQRAGVKTFTNIYLPAGAWCQVGIVNEGTESRFYIDGWYRESMAFGQGPGASAKVFLGSSDESGWDGYNGALDEVWFSHTVRSKEYLRLLFESQKRYSPFLTVLPMY